jgi:hypothetical protein
MLVQSLEYVNFILDTTAQCTVQKINKKIKYFIFHPVMWHTFYTSKAILRNNNELDDE